MSSNYDFYTHSHEPLLIVISGPSGVGKDTVIEWMNKRGLPFEFVVTATTRPPRQDEVHGVNYIFLTKDQFAEMIEKGELLEYAVVYEDFKGVPKEQVRKALASGRDVVMRLDVQGAATVKRLLPDAVLIFLSAASEEELYARLQARAADTDVQIQRRIETAREELQRLGEFDYVVVNAEGALEQAVDAILAIIQSEHCRVHPRMVQL